MIESAHRLLEVAVVGHTNTGKTSMMRTLMRDAAFGEITPSPGTTRQVESAVLMVEGRPALRLYDTPGLEDAGAVFESIERIPAARHQGPDRIRGFLDSAAAQFEQEARVLEQVLQCDAALYVIDAREPVLGKYQDELAILAMAARPVMPVLNFIAHGDNRLGQWRDALARVNLHTLAAFDTVVFSIDAEITLWQQLASLLFEHRPLFDALIAERRAQADWRYRAACRVAAELLIDAAAYRRPVRKDDPDGAAAIVERMREDVRRREQQAAAQLLDLYRFDEEDYADAELPVAQGRWEHDLFELEALKQFGLRAGTGAGMGAAGGLAVDVLFLGATFGVATLIGTLAGGGLGTPRALRRLIANRARGYREIGLDDAALRHLAWRQATLVRELTRRGHASLAPLNAPAESPREWMRDGLPRPLRRARVEPACSTLNEERDPGDARRERLVEELTAILVDEFSE